MPAAIKGTLNSQREVDSVHGTIVTREEFKCKDGRLACRDDRADD
jgi:hypothetical protein